MNVRRLMCLATVLLAVGWLSVTAGGQELKLSDQVIERTLPNGLKVLDGQASRSAAHPLHPRLPRRLGERAARASRGSPTSTST